MSEPINNGNIAMFSYYITNSGRELLYIDLSNDMFHVKFHVKYCIFNYLNINIVILCLKKTQSQFMLVTYNES